MSEIKKKKRLPSSAAARKMKGRNLQNWVRDLILALFPVQQGDVLSTAMGVSGVDVTLSPKAREHFNYDIECKNCENKSVWSCWEQTVSNEKKGKALLVMHKNHHEHLAIMRATDLFALLCELDKYKHPEAYERLKI